MSAIGAVISHLKDDFALSQRVGRKIYRLVAGRTATRPYVVVQQMSGGRRVRHMTAASALTATALQITCWADDVDAADAMADDVRNSLDHRNHEDIGTQPNVVTLKAAFLSPPFDNMVPDDATGKSIFGVVMPWLIWHAETVPTLS